MSTSRELRLEIFATIHDFLEAHYDCDCPRADPDGSHTAEALSLAGLVISRMEQR